MATVFSTETGKDGLVITGAVSSDDRIAIPDAIDGAKVTKLGSRFLRGIQGKADHTLIIPSSVRRAMVRCRSRNASPAVKAGSISSITSERP